VYPNPVHDNATIKNFQRIPVRFSIISVSGKVLLTGISGNEYIGLNLMEYPAGIYILNIVGSNFNLYYKILKQR
jgi:hypothetical protein